MIPPLQCEGDEFIMEKLIQVCNWGQADICWFNCCHIRVQVLMLADVIHGDGVTLQQWMKSYSIDYVGRSKYNWVREEPSSGDWTVWWEGLKLITSQNETLPFFDSLGNWLMTPHKVWEWHYSPSSRWLYQQLNGTLHEFAPMMSSTRYSTFIWVQVMRAKSLQNQSTMPCR